MHEKAPLLTAKHRERLGSRYSQRYRDKGELPGVVYGRGKEPVSILLNAEETIAHIKKGEKVFRLDFPGVKNTDEGQMVLLRDLQFDYLGNNIVHVDMARVSLTDRVRTRVAIHLLGEAKGLKQAGAILMHPNAVLAERGIMNKKTCPRHGVHEPGAPAPLMFRSADVAGPVEPPGAHAPEERHALAQVRAVGEEREGVGVGDRLEVAHLSPVHDVGDRQLDELAAAGAGDVRHGHDPGGHVAGRAVGAHPGADGGRQRVVQGRPLGEA